MKIPGTFRKIQGTFSEHLVNIQGTFREHSGNGRTVGEAVPASGYKSREVFSLSHACGCVQGTF
jgi:hypothetical protein